MWPDRVSNPGPLTYESGDLPTALRGPAIFCISSRIVKEGKSRYSGKGQPLEYLTAYPTAQSYSHIRTNSNYNNSNNNDDVNNSNCNTKINDYNNNVE